jgi:hypothetical protein
MGYPGQLLGGEGRPGRHHRWNRSSRGTCRLRIMHWGLVVKHSIELLTPQRLEILSHDLH